MRGNGKQAGRTCHYGGVEPVLASPVIISPAWFDDYDPEDLSHRPFTVRMELPVSAELMTAALYFYEKDPPYMLDADCVWGLAAVAIVQDGLTGVEEYVCIIRDEGEHGTVRHPESVFGPWLRRPHISALLSAPDQAGSVPG
jgi:hypothetical protein